MRKYGYSPEQLYLGHSVFWYISNHKSPSPHNPWPIFLLCDRFLKRIKDSEYLIHIKTKRGPCSVTRGQYKGNNKSRRKKANSKTKTRARNKDHNNDPDDMYLMIFYSHIFGQLPCISFLYSLAQLALLVHRQGMRSMSSKVSFLNLSPHYQPYPLRILLLLVNQLVVWSILLLCLKSDG